jgi:CRP-like cAMP-binding protein
MGNCLGFDIVNNPLLKESEDFQRADDDAFGEVATGDNDKKHQYLNASPFKLCMLDEHMLHVFAGLCTLQTIPAGQTFLPVGKEVKCLYVIGSGKAELFDEFGRALVVKQKGDWFGQGALFFGRNAGVPGRKSTASETAPLHQMRTRGSSMYTDEMPYGVRNPFDEPLECVKIEAKIFKVFLEILEFDDGMLPEVVADIEKKLTDIVGTRAEIVLKDIPLFQMNVSEAAKMPLLASMFHYAVLMEHELLFEEDEIGESLFILVSGGLKLKTRESASEKRRAVYVDLEPGSCLGELCLLGEMRRTATVVASERSLLLELRKQDFAKLQELAPEIAERILIVLKERMCLQFQRYDIPFFRAIPTEKYDLMGKLVEIVHFKAGDTIFRAGDQADCFYIIGHGSVKISYDQDEKSIELSKIHAGNYFGEIALITEKGVRSATAKAFTNCILVRMSKSNCEIFFKQVPEALQKFKERLLLYNMDVETVLKHPQGLNYFYLHCQKEFNTENINFWSAIQQFESFAKQSPSSDELRGVAGQMYQEFVAPGARHGCNLVVATVKNISSQLENPEATIDASIFNEAKSELLVLLRDPFTRFKSTKHFHKFLKELDAYEPVLDVKVSGP